jgi:hypothetical protein
MPSAAATAEHADPRPLSRYSESDRSELDKLNAAVERMKKNTRPDPYQVTIERDKRYQYEYQWKSQQWQWLHGTAFRPEEGEGIQYQTFVFQEPGTNMLSLHAQYYPEERPGTADSTRNATGSHTPAQGPKKVISFGAYKKKQTGETPTRESQAARDSDNSGKQPAVKGPAERIKTLEAAESADMLKAAEEDERAEARRGTQKSKEPLRREQASSKSPELKRKRLGDSDIANKAPETNGHESTRPVKKVKTDAPGPVAKDTKRARIPSPAPEKRPANKKKEDAEANMPPKLSPLHDVPPKLSPLRNEPHMRSPSRDVPPKLSPLHDVPQTPEHFEMPPRISPDLPDNISASLRMADGESITVSRTNRKRGEERSEGVNGVVTTKGKNAEQISSQRARSKSPERRVTDSSSLNASVNDSVHEVPEDAQELPDGKKRNSLVAKIKFKKARKEDVQRILKLPARPDKRFASPSSPPTPSDVEDNVEPVSTQKASSSTTAETTDKTDQERRSGKGVAQKIGPAFKKAEEKRPVAEKRPRAEPAADPTENSEPSAKRKRVDDTAPEPPSKKRQPDVAASQSASKKKAPGALDLKKAPSTPMPPAVPSPAMSSVQKTQLMTPVGRKDHLHPKRDASAESQIDTPSGHSNTPSDHMRTSQPNGTKPPSSNPQPTKAPTSQAWGDEQKRLEKLGRDLKHAASDLLNNKPNSTSRRTGAAKSLESLFCYLLAFTCSDRAALADNKNIPMRSWRSLTPFCSFVAKATQDFSALNGLNSSLSVVIHAHILDIAARYPSEGPSRDSLIELSGALHKAAVAADENLDIDTVMATFPKTWAGRSKTVVTELGGEPRKLLQGGGYRLPLGVQTDALQATRAGLAMLKEWLAKEGVEYDFKLA